MPNNEQHSVAHERSLGFILKLSSDKTIIKGGKEEKERKEVSFRDQGNCLEVLL